MVYKRLLEDDSLRRFILWMNGWSFSCFLTQRWHVFDLEIAAITQFK